tara:strand:- start:2957 stop:3358 length:402 start_codon:yes stop_codon:yes gene_type:complete
MSCQATTKEFIEMANSLINEFIVTPNAEWVYLQPYNLSDPNKPYIVNKATRKPPVAVKILFTLDDLEDRQQIKYRKETAIVDGQVNGYMVEQPGFSPTLKDIVIWNNRELTVAAIDPIQPIDCPILYFIEFKA